jgi:tripartite-type tricarboxylate transporter receptor subunit TctC
MRKEPPYDVLADFTPVTFLGENTFFIAVHPSIPAKTIPELIAHAKANPKVLNYAAGNT